jgi:hypothetical protein
MFDEFAVKAIDEGSETQIWLAVNCRLSRIFLTSEELLQKIAKKFLRKKSRIKRRFVFANCGARMAVGAGRKSCTAGPKRNGIVKYGARLERETH